jgi:hypothetical protein
MRRRRLLAALFVVLAFPGTAAAAGGDYVFDGGTARERLEVRRALNASSFPWGVVPERVVVHIVPGVASHATPGHIWVDADLLDGDPFGWAVVQDEYAHQVDFFVLDDADRALLNAQLGGLDWCYGLAGLAHSAYGCERFASTLVWAYWPSPKNAYRPMTRSDESAAMAPRPFRALLGRILAL